MRSSALALSFIGCWGGGCGFQTGVGPADAPGVMVDGAPVDMTGGEMPGQGCTTFSSQFDTCGIDAGDFMLTSPATFDTDIPGFVGGGITFTPRHFTTLAQPVEAIVARNVVIAAGVVLRAQGKMAGFAIVATGNVTIENGASIDVSNGGAGMMMSCSSAPTRGTSNASGGGGGGGAGYGGSSGNGGTGGNGAVPGGSGDSSFAMPSGPQGGCKGADGGVGEVANSGGVGGLGGGSLYIVAADTITLGDGSTLNAGGGGGGGGGKGINGGNISGGGGGGGGSGGMIFLEARRVTGPISVIAANGGGGGEGGDDNGNGMPGQTGLVSVNRASGGGGLAANGGDGGRGGSDQVHFGESVTTSALGGGGGGGGGVGYIRVKTTMGGSLGVVSPAPQQPLSP